MAIHVPIHSKTKIAFLVARPTAITLREKGTTGQQDPIEIVLKRIRANGPAACGNRKDRERKRRKTEVYAAEVSWMRRIIRTSDQRVKRGAVGEL
jgi:hypothetical protein